MSTLLQRVFLGSLVLGMGSWVVLGQGNGSPVKVTILDEKPVVTEVVLPIDPTPGVNFSPSNLGAQIRTVQNQTLHLSHFPILFVDGQIGQPGQAGGQFEKVNQPLPKTAGGKPRQGFQSVFKQNDLRITLTAELIPTKPSEKEQKRKMDSVLMRYTVENTGMQPRKFGLKVYMDTYVVTNDGCLFAAPTVPNKILDGIELKDKTLPDYVQLLQQPDLKNPGYVAHLTVNLGTAIEKASRVVLSRHGAGGFNGWEMPAMQSMGDSALAVFFEPKEIKPGGKREFGYAYGKGVAVPAESEGRVEVQLGGSFEPGKIFTVTALVKDPIGGQALTLELPKGLALLEGRETQPVPQPLTEIPQSVVLWKCRVLELGQFPLRVRSSSGVTHTKMITIAPNQSEKKDAGG
ncbi:MAG: hypothetical protein L0Y72_28900 [Gemmataceae bacterium]|nr:hypothetical protein [Gemmataceae bacterium]MCI0743067.1 hypothetical protein [Gemmataceae bacterium]